MPLSTSEKPLAENCGVVARYISKAAFNQNAPFVVMVTELATTLDDPDEFDGVPVAFIGVTDQTPTNDENIRLALLILEFPKLQLVSPA